MKRRAQWSLVLMPLVALSVFPSTARAADAVADSYSTPRTTPISVAAPGVLGNDVCESCAVVSVNGFAFEGQISFGPMTGDGDPLPTLPSGASLTVSSDGGFTYDPSTANDPNLAADSFTYQAEDSRGPSSEVTVSITITDPPSSSAPVAVDDQYTVEIGSVLTVSPPGILGNDSDSDGDPLTVATIDGVAPTFGSPISLTYGDLTMEQDGSFTYVPDPGATAGSDEGFSYTASDGPNASNTAFVAIALNESTSGTTVIRMTFGDVGFVTVDSEIGLTGVEQMEVGAAFGTSAQVSGGGLPPESGAVVLRSSDAATEADARNLFAGCERMALLAQAQPSKYDLVVEIRTASPAASLSQGGDGEVIVEVAETRVRCWTARASS